MSDVQDIPEQSDIDGQFMGVQNRLDASTLEPGYVSRARNRRFDRKVITNRWGIIRPVWGGDFYVSQLSISASTTNPVVTAGAPGPGYKNKQVTSDSFSFAVLAVTKTAGGSAYTNGTFALGFSGGGGTGAAGTFVVAGGVVTTITLTAGGHSYTTAPTVSFAASAGGSGATATVALTALKVYPNGTRILSEDSDPISLSALAAYTGSAFMEVLSGVVGITDIVGMLTYREPVTGLDVLLVASNQDRDDGGKGVVYALRPGQSSRTCLEDTASRFVPMNGHDFYGPVRMIQCASAVVMLRQGPTRYYFRGDMVNSAGDYITMATSPDQLATGDRVKFVVIGTPSMPGSVQDNGSYFVRNIGSNQVQLHTTANDAINNTNKINLTATTSGERYYLQVMDGKNFYTRTQTGNIASAAPGVDGAPLIMQANVTESSPLIVGFKRNPSVVTITSANTTTELVTAENHRLLPGDSIKLSAVVGLTGLAAATEYFVYPADPDTFYVYTQQQDALSNTVAARINITATGTADMRKTGVAGAPMPNCREGIWFNNRFIGVYGIDFIAVSDILDPITILPVQDELRANSGSNDRVVSIYPFNQTTILIFKERSVLALLNVSGDLSQMVMAEITRDFGCVAPLSIVSTGSDIIWLSQRGVVSLQQTQLGISQSVVLPLSDMLGASIEKIAWRNASNACGAYFGNKYLLSVPAEDDQGRNSLTLVYNFLNQAWDGEWSGALLIPRYYERLDVNGTVRLVFADSSGYIHFFDPLAWMDRTLEGSQIDIETEVLTRSYIAGSREHKMWTQVHTSVLGWNPKFSISALYDQFNEEQALLTDITRDRTKYINYTGGTYDESNINDDFHKALRRDYSLRPGFRCGANGVRVGVKQTNMEKARLAGHASALQIRIVTTQGSLDILSNQVMGIPYKQFGGED